MYVKQNEKMRESMKNTRIEFSTRDSKTAFQNNLVQTQQQSLAMGKTLNSKYSNLNNLEVRT